MTSLIGNRWSVIRSNCICQSWCSEQRISGPASADAGKPQARTWLSQERVGSPWTLGGKSSQGGHVTVWPPHAEPQQLWYLRPSGVAGEIALFSAANGLALGSASATSRDHRPVMS